MLKPATMDGTSRPLCLVDTRTSILQSVISDLTTLVPEKKIIWLSGMAGSGKSTISTTLAKRLHDRGQRGAFLFFNRDAPAHSGPEGVIRTIAYQLSLSNAVLRDAICNAIEKEPQIATMTLDVQFKALLLEPLLACSSMMTGPMVIILDAFDECGDAASRRALVYLLTTKLPLLPHHFRFFITGRPERDLQDEFSSLPEIKSVTLSAAEWSSSGDVFHYVQHEFNMLYQKRVASDELSFGWPGTHRTEQLASRCGDSFIQAATAIRYLRAADDLDESLDLLLSQQDSSLGDLYAITLRSASQWVPNAVSTETCRSILGMVVLTRIPLTDGAMIDILGLEHPKSCRRILRRLGCLLRWSEGQPVRTFHASFVDYLTDRHACGDQPWFIDESKHHADFTVGCLQVMKKLLRFNICGLKTSYLMNRDVGDLAERIKSSIPPSLAYACRFWSNHLRNAITLDHGVRLLILEFFRAAFLYWLEVLSLIGEGRAALDAMVVVESRIRDHEDAVHVFARDGIRFIGAFASVIADSAPHVYISTLPFAPSASVIRQCYSSIIKNTLRVTNGNNTDWPSCEQVIEGHTGNVYSVAFSPDSEHITSGSYDGTIRIWDARTGELVAGPFGGHRSVVSSVAFSPNGKHVVSGSWEKTIRIWDARTGELVAGPFKGHEDLVDSVAFSPDSELVASGSQDKTIRIWDARTGELVAGPFEGHTKSVSSVAFSPDSQHVVSGSWDETIRIWDARTGKLVAGPFKGHKHFVNSVAFSPDSELVASGSHDKTIRIWDARTGELVAGPFEGHTKSVSSVAFSPDSQHVVSGSWDYTIRIWDARTKLIAVPFEGHTSSVSSVAFSPDSEHIASGSWDNTIRIWDARTGELVAGPFEGHKHFVNSVAFSPDSELVASGSQDKTVRIWDARTGALVAGPFEGHTEPVTSVAFSPDSERVVSGSWDYTIRIWDARTGELIAVPFEEHMGWVNSVAFSPNSELVASGSEDKTVRIWDARTGALVAGPFEGHTSLVKSVTFSPDSKHVVSGSWDKTVRIWDARTGELVAGPFEGHTDLVNSVAFSPDSELVASGSDDKTVRIWHAHTGALVAGPFKWHTDHVDSVVFSPDGKHLVSGSSDKTIRIFEIPTDASSHSRVSRGYTSSSYPANGWMQNSPTQLLFWVPPEYRTGLWQPSDTVVIGQSTCLDLTHFVYGDNWAQCHV
ncbi:WD40 repeat-like protein [Athelia psychrophila]|uniref:WD40 repeat-like protein n=1 Tax=Athelia psychrophila TaxID=1759441 RepID=A0A165Z8Q6_9AGAM|nr:WD40 repeat-like protein [Fibularhizoctonia sp. CBS 109695]